MRWNYTHGAALRSGARTNPRAELGLADILAARRIIFVARGSQKAAAVRRMLRDPISDACPASHLRSHPNLRILLDAQAAALL